MLRNAEADCLHSQRQKKTLVYDRDDEGDEEKFEYL